ncbi:TB2/DP1, HVA22 family-domain-containing protein [Parachaetomium inaequale]|uniref:Protein YOP1 n=1 Tax=Parachaetomium inaequale TaxID=2588326 RepID=A0AAN6SR41_9PEZI|nr:TB2/DP1, HVA22 family-domain-containing protein [Parachaetomium inaequale]
MFDVFAKLLSSIASFLFPLFASYKALKTADPAQLTPWLMYWVVLACALLVESWTDWFLVWIPFYAYIRLLFLLYLVLPQTQGARLIYEEYIHPRLEENETAIEEFIASAHDRLRSAGVAYLNRAIEMLKTNVLGMAPSPEPPAAAEPHTPQSYTQSLLARFTLPSPRWNTATAQGQTQTGGGSGGLTADFFNLLTTAVSAAASATTTTTTTTTRDPSSSTWTGAGAASIIPDSIRAAGAAARVAFIQAQRERLRVVLSALDREEEAAARQTQTQQTQGLGGDDNGGSGDRKRGSSVGEQSAASSSSGGGGLSKSRSEGDFEKLDAPSGGEEGEGETGGVRRRGGGLEAPAGRSGGWMPWGWGGGGEAGRSSGMER